MQKRLVLLIALLALTLAGVHAGENLRSHQVHSPNWSAVPYEVYGGWLGVDTAFDPVYGTDPADSSLLRVYNHKNQGPVIVYVGFYTDLTKILEVHTPELCYPGQGWSVSGVRSLSGRSFRGQEIHAKELLAEKGGSRRMVKWWYNSGSRTFENRIRYVYATLAMSMFTGRSDGSLVRIETPIDQRGESDAGGRIEDFCKTFLPKLEDALP